MPINSSNMKAEDWLDDLATIGQYAAEKADKALMSIPIPKSVVESPAISAMGKVMANPTMQEIGTQAVNVAKVIPQKLQEFSEMPPVEQALAVSPGATIIGKGAKGWAQAENKFSSLFDKMERAEISDYSSKFGIIHPKNISDYIISKTKKPQGVSVDLSEILSHPKLYEQYPDLSKKRVLIKDLASGTLGYYDDGLLVIDGKLFRDNPELARTTLLHELQHLIQQEEGFARGSNQGAFVPSMAKEIDMYSSAKDIKDLSLERGISIDEAVKYIKDLGLESPSQESYMIASTRDKNYIDKMLKQYEDNWAGKSFELYQNTAGEIEARSVARRSNIPQEQLKYSQPYAGENIPLKEWIKAEDFLDQ